MCVDVHHVCIRVHMKRLRRAAPTPRLRCAAPALRRAARASCAGKRRRRLGTGWTTWLQPCSRQAGARGGDCEAGGREAGGRRAGMRGCGGAECGSAGNAGMRGGVSARL